MAALASNMIHHHHFSRRNLDSTDGSVSMDSSDNFDIESPNIDNISCTSDNTVLSVGNENPDPPQSSSDGGTLSFKNIESHLNAISQITNSTLNPESSPIQHRLSPSSSTKSYTDSPNFLYRNIDSNSSEVLAPSLCSPRSTSDSDSPRSPGRQQENLYYNQNRNSDKNNDANQGSLKFSIDNILKADFGRRITDPINIRKSKPKRVLPKNEATKSSGPVDLSKNDTTPADNASKESTSGKPPILWPAWVYCTRYSDRPSSGPRTRRVKKPGSSKQGAPSAEEKRPRTAFSGAQLARLKHEFAENRYLTERRRQQLSAELGLNEAQIKIWFQNKRAKIKKASGQKNPLALQLMAQGLYNHSTIPLSKEEEELEKMQGTSGAS